MLYRRAGSGEPKTEQQKVQLSTVVRRNSLPIWVCYLSMHQTNFGGEKILIKGLIDCLHPDYACAQRHERKLCAVRMSVNCAHECKLCAVRMSVNCAQCA